MSNETAKAFDMIAFLDRTNSGEMLDDATMVEGFKHLVDSGLIRHLTNPYKAVARDMIEAGEFPMPDDKATKDALASARGLPPVIQEILDSVAPDGEFLAN